VWVGFGRESSIARIDPATGSVERFEVGERAPGDKEQNLVYRIDPKRPAVIDSFGAGPGAFVALRAYGSMWVTSYAGSDVRRFRP
jgi:streptogramin lyase